MTSLIGSICEQLYEGTEIQIFQVIFKVLKDPTVNFENAQSYMMEALKILHEEVVGTGGPIENSS